MQERLKWNAIGLEKKTVTLLKSILTEKEKIPTKQLKNIGKLQLYIDELKHILDTIENIQNKLIPELEKTFRLNFKTPELILLALSRPSIRVIYEQLEEFFTENGEKPLDHEDFQELASSGDIANVLALIGDSALDLAVVQSLWDSSLTTTGKLTEKRKQLVSNENLAKICDDWNLYNYRLNRLSDIKGKNTKLTTLRHEKGTLVESLFGVIFLEFGFEILSRIIPFIQ